MRADCMPKPWPEPEPVSLACPFCGDDDFDHYGLQRHLMIGLCPNFGRYDSRNTLTREATK